MHYNLKFGLADMYGKANAGYRPIPNDELECDVENAYLISGEGIMDINGSASDNDIEMILLAFCENEKQYYVPRGTTQKMSKAIKKETFFCHISNSKERLIWNSEKHSFQNLK